MQDLVPTLVTLRSLVLKKSFWFVKSQKTAVIKVALVKAIDDLVAALDQGAGAQTVDNRVAIFRARLADCRAVLPALLCAN